MSSRFAVRWTPEAEADALTIVEYFNDPINAEKVIAPVRCEGRQSANLTGTWTSGSGTTNDRRAGLSGADPKTVADDLHHPWQGGVDHGGGRRAAAIGGHVI